MVKLISPAPGGTRGLAYGDTKTPPYSAYRPHRGQDWEREWKDLSKPRPVVSPVPGRVTKVYAGSGNNDGWGRRVEITVSANGVSVVAAVNHLATVAVRVGQEVHAGTYLGEMGNSGEAHGVHLHEELWINGIRVDPNPYRTRDLPGTAPAPAGGGAKPLPTPAPPPPLEDDDMLMIKINKTHLVALGVGVFRHFIESDPFDKIMRVSRIQDDWQDITLAELPAFLRTYGCDLNIWDVRNGQFVILDPLTGNVGPGNVWTSTGAARGQANGIETSIRRLTDEVAKINADYVAKAA